MTYELQGSATISNRHGGSVSYAIEKDVTCGMYAIACMLIAHGVLHLQFDKYAQRTELLQKPSYTLARLDSSPTRPLSRALKHMRSR